MTSRPVEVGMATGPNATTWAEILVATSIYANSHPARVADAVSEKH